MSSRMQQVEVQLALQKQISQFFFDLLSPNIKDQLNILQQHLKAKKGGSGGTERSKGDKEKANQEIEG